MAIKKKQRVNEDITAPSIRLIDQDGEQAGIMDRAAAFEMAEKAGLDLVEISPNADPPVCRVMDYGKFLYEDSKRKAAARKNQKQIQVKEIKFRPGTDVGDYDIKLRKLTEFLQNGDKTKVTIRFRGREMAHKELGIELLKRIETDLEEYGSVEQFPKLEGRQMVMVLAPIKNK
ncbi:MAG: translation initiation factor IF-3 [Gammaproteobacteria bacterium]|nr:translation initiation factor IF-3 [Gammaproteobacteria bacterium]